MGRVRLSFCELNKGILTIGQRGKVLLGRPLSIIIITKAMRSKSKKQFQNGVKLVLLCNNSKSLFPEVSWHNSWVTVSDRSLSSEVEESPFGRGESSFPVGKVSKFQGVMLKDCLPRAHCENTTLPKHGCFLIEATRLLQYWHFQLWVQRVRSHVCWASCDFLKG